MNPVSFVNPADIPVVPKSNPNDKLDQTAFLRLMTTQLRAQDPFNPIDNQAMVAQLAQFSSVSGISEINTSLKSIATQISEQTRLLSALQPPTPSAT